LRPSDDDVNAGHGSFLAFTTTRQASREVRKIENKYDPSSSDQINRFVVLEFAESSRLKGFVEILQQFSCIRSVMGSDAVLDGLAAKDFCVSLFGCPFIEEDSKNQKDDKSEPWSPHFLRGRRNDDVLLVYPFSGDKVRLEKAAEGLKELGAFGPPESAKTSCSDTTENEEEPSSSRAHYLTITVGDCERLEPGVFLNDTLIDFFMRWYV
jgi:hypothetical protein